VDTRALAEVYVSRHILLQGLEVKKQWTPGMRPEEFIAPTRATLDRLEALVESADSQNIVEIANAIQARLKAGDMPQPWTTSIPILDNQCGGLHGGHLYVFGACTHVGKTALALTILNHVAKQGGDGLIFSFETTREEVLYRLMGHNGRRDAARIRLRQVTDQEFADMAAQVPKNIECTDKMANTDQLRAKAKEWRARVSNPAVLVVDYLEKVGVSEPRLSREQQVARISGTCQALAKELRLPVVLLSQLSRDARGREPQMTDMRYSGQIENDASFVCLMWAPERAEGDETDEIEGKLKVVKNRITGKFPRCRYVLLTAFSHVAERSEFDSNVAAAKNEWWDN